MEGLEVFAFAAAIAAFAGMVGATVDSWVSGKAGDSDYFARRVGPMFGCLAFSGYLIWQAFQLNCIVGWIMVGFIAISWVLTGLAIRHEKQNRI